MVQPGFNTNISKRDQRTIYMLPLGPHPTENPPQGWRLSTYALDTVSTVERLNPSMLLVR